MFVFRVLLGRAYICREPKQFKRPPCTDTSCCSDTCSKHSLYDSVIGTHNFTATSSAMTSLHLPFTHSQQVILSSHYFLHTYFIICNLRKTLHECQLLKCSTDLYLTTYHYIKWMRYAVGEQYIWSHCESMEKWLI